MSQPDKYGEQTRTVDSPMSLHLQINALGTSPGGAATVWAALVSGLGQMTAELGESTPGEPPFQVTVLSNHSDVASLIEEADVGHGIATAIRIKGGNILAESRIVRDAVSRHQPDVLLTHNRNSFGFAGPQITLHINQIRFESGLLARGPKQVPAEMVRDALAIRALRSGSANVFESAFLLEAARNHYPRIKISNPSFTHVGVERAWLRSPEEVLPEVGDRGLRILAVTSPNIHKDNGTLIRTLALLADDAGDPGWRLLLAGGSSPAVWDPIMYLATELGVADRIELLGFLDRDQLKAELDRATVLASPSLVESFAMVPLEAMARGVPAVVTNATSMPESVGDAGIIVPPSSPEAMSTAIANLADADVWHARSVRSRTWAAAMTWERFARDMVDTARKLVA